MPPAATVSTATGSLGSAGNLHGIAAMIAANAVLSANDACLKLASSTLPTGELIFIRNSIGALAALIVVLSVGAGGRLRQLPLGLFSGRAVTDICGSLLFIMSLVRMPFADAVAIGQCLPLMITAAAALVLGEAVGWRRWLATGIGFVGVLLIIRPGTSAFTPASLLGLGSVVAITVRDLITRRIPPAISSLLLAFLSMLAVAISSLGFLVVETWRIPNATELALLAAAGVMLFVGYVLLVMAMRSASTSQRGSCPSW